MAEALNINASLAALGRTQPFAPGERFGIKSSGWHPDVQEFAGAYPLKSGDTMFFRAQNAARPGRPALVRTPKGEQIVGSVAPGHVVLAECCGVDWS